MATESIQQHRNQLVLLNEKLKDQKRQMNPFEQGLREIQSNIRFVEGQIKNIEQEEKVKQAQLDYEKFQTADADTKADIYERALNVYLSAGRGVEVKWGRDWDTLVDKESGVVWKKIDKRTGDLYKDGKIMANIIKEACHLRDDYDCME